MARARSRNRGQRLSLEPPQVFGAQHLGIRVDQHQRSCSGQIVTRGDRLRAGEIRKTAELEQRRQNVHQIDLRTVDNVLRHSPARPGNNHRDPDQAIVENAALAHHLVLTSEVTVIRDESDDRIVSQPK